MSNVQLYFSPALESMGAEELGMFKQILTSCGPETAVPSIREIYHDLIANLGTFGSCMVATALFVAHLNKRAKETGAMDQDWCAMLVRDPEFGEDNPLGTHWLAFNKARPDLPAVDVTVADQEKEMLTLGSAAENEAVNDMFKDTLFLKRLQAGLDRFVDPKTDAPFLPGVMAKDLLQEVYGGLLAQAARPSMRLRVVPFAMLKKHL